jgi:SAM-dependent methyltransferase
LLGLARSLARELEGRLVSGDARAIPLSNASLDGVVSLFSSFGYFGEAGDRAVVREVGRVLRPGGILFLDLMNPARVRSTLVPRSVTERDGVEIAERRALADEGRRVVKEVRMRLRDGSTTSWREDVRLYEARDLATWLSDAGLDLGTEYGDFDGSMLSAVSPRQILVIRRR